MRQKLLLTILLALSVLGLQKVQATVLADNPVSSSADYQADGVASDTVQAVSNISGWNDLAQTQTAEPESVAQIQVISKVATFTPTPSPTPIPTVAPVSAVQVVNTSRSSQFPTLDEFAAEVRSQGMQGIWADGLFAYRFIYTSWGVVPGSWNTASYASYAGYGAFFIHNFLGGSSLYNVGSGTRVAVIRSDSIDWYTINGVYRFAGTSTGNGCEYTAPFYDWNGGNTYSAMDLISTYYSAPFAIQTCICTGDKNGIFVLTGS